MHKIRSAIVSGDGLQAYTPLAPKQPPPRRAVETELGSLAADIIPREQPRITDHRREDRVAGEVERATLSVRGEQVTVSVINTSSRGLMIEADFEAYIGEEVGIELQEGIWSVCLVRWRRGERMGLGFREQDLLDG
jgi:hypothetical protein